MLIAAGKDAKRFLGMGSLSSLGLSPGFGRRKVFSAGKPSSMIKSFLLDLLPASSGCVDAAGDVASDDIVSIVELLNYCAVQINRHQFDLCYDRNVWPEIDRY